MIFTTAAIRRTFAGNLKFLRESKGFTQDQLAFQIGISRPALGSYEECRAMPPLSILIVMSNKLEFDIKEICTVDLSIDSHDHRLAVVSMPVNDEGGEVLFDIENDLIH